MSQIIFARDKTKSLKKALSICSTEKIDQFDITLISKKEDLKSIGIKEIKEMIQKIYLKPLKSKKKAIILEDSEFLTQEAQSSLLKTLEEPPDNTLIFLLSNSKDKLLPTILSRCKIIEIKEITDGSINTNLIEQFNLLKELDTKTAIEIAEKNSKDKEKTIDFVASLIKAGQKDLLRQIDLEKKQNQFLTCHILKKLQVSYKNLTATNINTRLELEHLFLSLTSKNLKEDQHISA